MDKIFRRPTFAFGLKHLRDGSTGGPAQGRLSPMRRVRLRPQVRPRVRPVLQAAILAALGLWPGGGGIAQQGCQTDAMLVFDGSGSMAEMGFNMIGEPRILSARRAVGEVMPEVALVRRIGLLVYGPGADECSGVDLRFGPRADAARPVIEAIDRLRPEGGTPLTESVARAAEVLGWRERAGIVVLVTDGKETCGGAPCALAATFAAEARDLVVQVIGFKVRGAHFGWGGDAPAGYEPGEAVARCLADRTGGFYVSTETTEELAAALRQTLGCQLMGGAFPVTDRRRRG